MTTDRELLELAAKAAGLHIKSYAVDTDDKLIGLVVGRKFTKEKVVWSPLTDDGAALRLATILKADVKFHDGGVSVYIEGCQQGYFEDIGDDPYAATRRAIVRAAAEIGRNME